MGASLAMESAPPRWRGVLSGILQSGYSVGYLLAAVAARTILPTFGWRAMFWVGGLPALLALYIRAKVPESEAWQQHRKESLGAILRTVAVPGSQQAFEAVTEGYRLGRFGLQDVLDAQRALIGAGSQHVQALADYLAAVAEVERLIGAPLADATAAPATPGR